MKLSKVALLLIAIVYVVSFFSYRSSTRQYILHGGDSFGYYCYLPAVFIHHDLLHLRYSVCARDNNLGHKRDSTQAFADVQEVTIHNAVPVLKYTPGVAVLELPAFFAAYTYCHFFDKEHNDGYSPPYMFAVHFWNLIVVFIGMVFLRNFLCFRFSDGIVATTLIAIGLATNLYHFSVYNVGMAHGYLFMLYALLLLYTHRFYINATLANAIAIGFSMGMITLIRPNEITALFIPLLYGIHSFSILKGRVKYLLSQSPVLAGAVVYLLCALPVIAYWHYTTGNFIFYSYGNERFYFNNPHIIFGLFGYGNGWLPYTPVMIFACLGILLLFLRPEKILLPLLIILPIHIYVIYSWWCYNYVNGLGSRPMIDVYPLLSVPLALFVTLVFKNRLSRIVFCSVLLLLVLQQFLFTLKVDRNYLWSEDSSPTFYFQTLFKTTLSVEDLIVYDTNEKQPQNATYIRTLSASDFEIPLNSFYKKDTIRGGYFYLDSNARCITGLAGTLQSLGLQQGQWLKVSADACNQWPAGGLYRYASMAVEITRNGKQISKKRIRIQNKLTDNGTLGIWRADATACGNVSFFTKIPARANQQDSIKVYLFNDTYSPEIIDNFKVELYEDVK